MSLDNDQITKIKVFGVGGAGCNAVNRMVEEMMQGVEFYVANTDLQVLNVSSVVNKILLGKQTTGGRGAGADPKMGREAANESEAEIRAAIKGSDMVFITAGMGGGTGTGASPLFAKIAKEEGALTMAIVTKPFDFESSRRMKVALTGIEELREYVDGIIVVSNNKLLDAIGDISITDAFKEADNILRQGVQTISDLIAVPSLVNLDFADVKSVIGGQGSALIGIGMAQGEDKSIIAADKAINSPLLEIKINGAKKAIINITGGQNVSLYDARKAVDYIREATGDDLDIFWGVAINDRLGENIIVTVIATGFGDTPGANYRPFSKSESSTNEQEENPDQLDGIPGFFKRRN